jgi:hypothetical protein
LIGSATELCLLTHPEPISETEAEQLAADYDRQHALGLAPYAAPTGGGLALAGRF